jgi:hypothetical protein
MDNVFAAGEAKFNKAPAYIEPDDEEDKPVEKKVYEDINTIHSFIP